MKKILVLLTVMASVAFADQARMAVETPNKQEASKMDVWLGMVLNQVQSIGLDGQFDLTFEDKKAVQVNLLEVQGMVKFNESIDIALVENKSDKNENLVGKVIPRATLGLKSLYADANFSMVKRDGKASVKFYSGFDQKTKTWLEKPLTLRIANELISEGTTIRLHSVSMQFAQAADADGMHTFEGSCVTDKEKLDMLTGRPKLVLVRCEFKGAFNKAGKYKFNVKYLNN